MSQKVKKTTGGKRNAVMSMAQTRATSKAFRLNFAFVAQLGGYQSLPWDEVTDQMKGIYEPEPEYQGAVTIQHKGVEADIPVQVKQVSDQNKEQPPSERQLEWINQFIDKDLVARDTVYDANGDPIITKQEASDLITLNSGIK